jgi:hypothetical protein
LDGPEGDVWGYQTTVALLLSPGWGIDDVLVFYEGTLGPSWSVSRVAASRSGATPETPSLNGARTFIVPTGPRLRVTGQDRELLVVGEPPTDGLGGTFEVVIDHDVPRPDERD